MPAAESELLTPSPSRLVIRIKLVPQAAPQPPLWRRLGGGTLLLIIGIVVVLLGWLGFSSFERDQPHPQPAVVTTVEPAPKPIEPVAPPPAPDAPTAAINEVIPDTPKSALDTIRGTIRVSVRVIIDKQGTVLEAKADDRGPSRYFERLAVDAAKKWIFTPANLVERREMLVKFNFTRSGVTADAGR